MCRLFYFTFILFPFLFCSRTDTKSIAESKTTAVASRIFPTNLFSSPLHRPIAFSGVYSEIRLHHFHTGIDLRVGGVVGEPVYAMADGYVCRICVMSGGGGKILAVAHQEGYVTYFMHLNGYADAIQQLVDELQRNKQCYEVDTTLPAGAIPVRRGDVIAYVGNSGSSAGAHLHFEIRDATGKWYFNPLLFGFEYDDNIVPTIRGIRLYPASVASMIDSSRSPVSLKTDQVRVAGPFYLGVYATDASNGSTLRNGVRRIEVNVDGREFFYFQVDSLPSGCGYLVNPVVDYDYYYAHREGYVLTRRLKGMRDSHITWASPEDGVLCFEPGSSHRVVVSVYDCKGNRAERSFSVLAESTTTDVPTAVVDNSYQRFVVPYDRSFSFRHSCFEVDMSAETLFDDDTLCYAVASSSKYLSPIFHLHTTCNVLPPRKSYRVAIRRDQCRSVVPGKMMLALVNEKNVLIANPVVDSAGYFVANVYGFGQFAMTSDTKPPMVKPANFKEGGMIRTKQLRVKVSDNLSGITQYKCYINGSWVLAAYDRRIASLVIDADTILAVGANTLRVAISDACGNATDVTYRFNYNPAPVKGRGSKRRR